MSDAGRQASRFKHSMKFEHTRLADDELAKGCMHGLRPCCWGCHSKLDCGELGHTNRRCAQQLCGWERYTHIYTSLYSNRSSGSNERCRAWLRCITLLSRTYNRVASRQMLKQPYCSIPQWCNCCTVRNGMADSSTGFSCFPVHTSGVTPSTKERMPSCVKGEVQRTEAENANVSNMPRCHLTHTQNPSLLRTADC